MATVNEIIARSRTIATQMGGDANASPVIDDRGGLRALLDHVVRDIYRKKANDPKMYHDVVARSTVSMTAGSGSVPDALMREFLTQAQFEDANGFREITFFEYESDYYQTTKFGQLGYATIRGNNFLYTAPLPTTSYTGNLYVNCPVQPTVPTNQATELDVTDADTDDIILALAMAIRGEYKFEYA